MRTAVMSSLLLLLLLWLSLLVCCLCYCCYCSCHWYCYCFCYSYSYCYCSCCCFYCYCYCNSYCYWYCCCCCCFRRRCRCSNRSTSATSGARCDLPSLSGERHLRPQQGASLNEFNPKQLAVQQFCKYTPLINFLPLLPVLHDFIGNYSKAQAIQVPSCPSRRLSCCSAVSGSSSSSELSENSCT
jgi:hypothetical protein